MYTVQCAYSYKFYNIHVCDDFRFVYDVEHPSPMPLNKVQDLQAVFSWKADGDIHVAKVSWSPLERSDSDNLGCGAYDQWSYEVSISSRVNSDGSIADAGTETELEVELPAGEVEYEFKVRAKSSNGLHVSSWSNGFETRALPSDARKSSLVWWEGGHVHMSDLSGRSDAKVYDIGGLKDVVSDTDSMWYANDSALVMIMNFGGRKVLASGDGIQSLALEPYAKHIYFSNPSQRLISRVSYGSNAITNAVPIVKSSATDIAVNSALAKLCWVRRGQTVQCSGLNGQDKKEVFAVRPWSGEVILGMAADQQSNLIYVMVRSYNVENSLSLASVNLQSQGMNKVTLKTDVFDGHLRFFYGKLAWVAGQGIVVYDVSRMSEAVISLGEKPVRAFCVAEDNVVYPPNVNSSQFNVIPSEVMGESVILAKSDGDSLVLSWDPVTNVDIGNVSYRLLVQSRFFSVVSNRLVLDPDLAGPNSVLNVSLVAVTPWAYSQSTNVQLVTPESAPGPISFVRVYYEPNKEEKEMVNFTVVWEPPGETNGVLTHSQVNVYSGIKTLTKTYQVSPEEIQLSYLMPEVELKSAGSVAFGVVAANTAGTGPEVKETVIISEPIHYKPMPLLYMLDAKGSSVKLVNSDMPGKTLKKHNLNIQPRTNEMLYWSQEESLVFLSNDWNTYGTDVIIMPLNNNRAKGTQILASFASQACCLALDHLSRSAILAVKDSNVWTITRLYLDKTETGDHKNVTLLSVDFQPSKIRWNGLAGEVFIVNGTYSMERFKMQGTDSTQTYLPPMSDGNREKPLYLDAIIDPFSPISKSIAVYQHQTVVGYIDDPSQCSTYSLEMVR